MRYLDMSYLIINVNRNKYHFPDLTHVSNGSKTTL